jgi:RNA-directed DNA polymerase
MSELLTRLGASLLLSEHELMKLIRSAPRRYKVFEIPKRKQGQFRVIAQPAREVKALQYWVMEHLLSKFPIHPAATAYREGKSIADNASPHRHGRFLLKLDFTDFFPSLRAYDFRRYLEKNFAGLEDGDVEAFSRILFWKPKGTKTLCLSIGAPSSPTVSNLLLHSFDERVATFCTKHGVVYTRYADDLSFSAGESSKLDIVESFVTALCRQTARPKLTLNLDKLVRVSKKEARRITGLVITNDAKVSLGREKKRQIRASVHHFTNGRLDSEECLKLKGMLAYVKSVEPSFLNRLRKKYGNETIRRIQTIL